MFQTASSSLILIVAAKFGFLLKQPGNKTQWNNNVRVLKMSFSCICIPSVQITLLFFHCLINRSYREWYQKLTVWLLFPFGVLVSILPLSTSREHFSGKRKNGRRNLRGRTQVWPLRAVTGAHGWEEVLSSHVSTCSRLWAAEVVLHSHPNACCGGTRLQGHCHAARRPVPPEPPAPRCRWVPAPWDPPGAFSPCLSSCPTASRQGEQGRYGAGAWCPDHRWRRLAPEQAGHARQQAGVRSGAGHQQDRSEARPGLVCGSGSESTRSIVRQRDGGGGPGDERSSLWQWLLFLRYSWDVEGRHWGAKRSTNKCL